MSELKIIAGGKVVDPASKLDKVADVYIENGKVKKIETKKTLTPKEIKELDPEDVYNAKGKIVSPGLVDMHVHLREPGREGDETILSGSEAAAAGGFTTICCMPNTTPAIDNQETIKFVLHQAEECPINVYPIAAITKGRMGKELAEIGELVNAGAVGLSDDGSPVNSAEIMLKAFKYAGMFTIPIIEHAEDLSLTADGVMNEGFVSTRLGMKGVPSVSEEIMVARDTLLAQYTGGKLHFAHISTAGAVELIRQAKKFRIDVTAEVTPHHFSLYDEMIAEDFDPSLKMSPPLRSKDDARALIKGLVEGTIDCIASDHAPHSPESKDVEFDLAPNGIIGLETSLGVCITYLVKKRHMNWKGLIKAMSTRPAEILGLEAGALKKGYAADITVIDPNKKWVVDPEKFRSKSRNSPYIGKTLTGKAVCTIVNGKIVYSED
ncbi:MAG: amidohydrolase family protein [candidate division Zixibacteria bacterium]|nr:amidohydrolase family protein [candidate division Zixibacteria bacterium]